MLTRRQSQCQLGFKVQKNTRTRSKVTTQENAPVVASPKKRSTTRTEADLCSPTKITRITSVKNSKTEIALESYQSHVRVPLSPRKHPNTPVSNATIMKVLPSPTKTPTQGFTLKDVTACSASKIKALNFDSPTSKYTTFHTPEKKSITKGRFLDFSEDITLKDVRSPQKALFSPSVRSSPRKSIGLMRLTDRPLSSPTKSPRKSIGTPRPFRVKPIMSPLRLARQEGVCYQRARKALHTALPEKLHCREEEVKRVDNFLDGHLGKKKAGSLYISGAPGTGKTAILTRTLNKLKEDSTHQVVYVNCMSMRNSQAIYNKILSELKGSEVCLPTKQAALQLEKALSASGKMVVLILDEMDQLDSKNQEVLYTVFEWPSLQKSRLVLIGIANSLDLTDRILPRLQARPNCRPELLHFAPYTRAQIVTILTERLKQVETDGSAVLDNTAIQMCARKVAAVAGDMRKALDVCRRAIEVVESEVKRQQVLTPGGSLSPSKRPMVPKKIGVAHILKIVNEVYGSRVVTSSGEQQNIPLQQKLAICSLLLMVKHGKTRQVQLGKLHETYCRVCTKRNVAKAEQGEFLSMMSMTEARGIVGLKRGKDTRNTKIYLKLDEKELEHALQDTTLISSVLSDGLSK